MSRVTTNLIPLMAILTFAAGCQSTWTPQRSPLLDRGWMSSQTKIEGQEIEYGTPERMAVIWTDSIASASNQPNVRGFGGRLYFYDKDGRAIRVDGDLSVYAFDDSKKSQKAQADRVYKFRREEWQTHFSETSLGPSYSIWIPWDQVGGDRKTIALLPIFKTPDNLVVKTGQSINVLPGKTPVQIVAQTSDVYRVLGSSPAVASDSIAQGISAASTYPARQTSYTEWTDESLPTINRSTTITVPRQMARRLHQQLAASNVDGAMPGSEVQVSYGRDADPRVGAGAQNGSPGGAVDHRVVPPLTTSSSADNTASRPVFGAPGARR